MIPHELSKKILTIGPDCRKPQGGVAQVIASLSQMLSPFRFVPTMIDMGHSMPRKLWVAVSALVSAAWQMRPGSGVEAVHLHVCSGNSFRRKSMFVKLARMMGKRVVMHMHGGGMREYYAANRAFVEKVLSMADCVVALTPSWAEWYSSLGVCRSVEVILNPVVVSRETRVESRESRVESPGFNLIFLGKLCREKGVYDLLDAIAKHRDKFSLIGLRLTLGGNGEVDSVKEYAAELGISPMVDLAGWVDGERKFELIEGCDAMILPSYREGFPICLLEAMAFRKPVIATPVGGIPEVMTDGDNALLVPPGDVDGIADAIIRLATDRNLAETIGNRGGAIADEHSMAVVEQRLQQLYKKILSSTTT